MRETPGSQGFRLLPDHGGLDRQAVHVQVERLWIIHVRSLTSWGSLSRDVKLQAMIVSC